MTTERMFEIATRNKFRFPYKGMISVEDLWDLPLTALDSIYKTLNKQVKQDKEDSLLETRSKESEVVELQIAIVKYIVSTKQIEAAAKIAAKENADKRRRIMEIMANKQDEELMSKTVEELQKMLDTLGG